MTMHVNVSGVWKALTPSINISGTWKNMSGGWVNVSGVWKQFYSSTTDSHTWPGPATAAFDNEQLTSTTCSVNFVNDGNITGHVSNTANTDVGDWISPKDSFSDYEIYGHVETGTLYAGTVDTWLNLGTTRTWSVRDTTTTGGSVSATMTFTIRRASDTTVVWTSNTGGYTLTANRVSA